MLNLYYHAVSYMQEIRSFFRIWAGNLQFFKYKFDLETFLNGFALSFIRSFRVEYDYLVNSTQ